MATAVAVPAAGAANTPAAAASNCKCIQHSEFKKHWQPCSSRMVMMTSAATVLGAAAEALATATAAT